VTIAAVLANLRLHKKGAGKAPYLRSSLGRTWFPARRSSQPRSKSPAGNPGTRP